LNATWLVLEDCHHEERFSATRDLLYGAQWKAAIWHPSRPDEQQIPRGLKPAREDNLVMRAAFAGNKTAIADFHQVVTQTIGVPTEIRRLRRGKNRIGNSVSSVPPVVKPMFSNRNND